MSNGLVVREYLGNVIEFKVIDGHVYANATSMCKIFNKQPSDWNKLKGTKEYIEALEGSEDFPKGLKSIIVVNDGFNNGTYIYEKLILDLARWLNVKFRIWCDEQIETLLREGYIEIKKEPKVLSDNPFEILESAVNSYQNIIERIGLQCPKEIILSVGINGAKQLTNHDYKEALPLLNKVEEEPYHSPSKLLKPLGIKGNCINKTLCSLNLQVKGTSTIQKYILTELGKKYAIERSYAKNGHQGYEIKWKETLIDFTKEHFNEIPAEYLN